jgi:hypothetical protein
MAEEIAALEEHGGRPLCLRVKAAWRGKGGAVSESICLKLPQVRYHRRMSAIEIGSIIILLLVVAIIAITLAVDSRLRK